MNPLEPAPGYRPSAVGEAALERARAFLADEALPMVEEVERSSATPPSPSRATGGWPTR